MWLEAIKTHGQTENERRKRKTLLGYLIYERNVLLSKILLRLNRRFLSTKNSRIPYLVFCVNLKHDEMKTSILIASVNSKNNNYYIEFRMQSKIRSISPNSKKKILKILFIRKNILGENLLGNVMDSRSYFYVNFSTYLQTWKLNFIFKFQVPK